ncbi:MAG TPA: HAMP domain-containing sensor histidine kinase [Longimicrobium sp.]|jgi:signal transduction histidine kinase|uniref:sensor histidine kinase n=1 Tax=Longimicrobium sp. TaxID=2029185 RepID=UPI002EDB0F1C
MKVARRGYGGRLGSSTLAGAAGMAGAAATVLVLAGAALPRWAAPLTLLAAAVGLGAAALLQRRVEREDERVRRAIAAGLAHTLRTPLAHVRMNAEMLASGRVTGADDQERAVLEIESSTRRLARVVENVVAYASLSRPGLPLLPRPVDLGALVEDAVADALEASRARGMTLTADPPGGLMVQADADALRLALDNLIENALQHGTAGDQVTVDAAQEGGHALVRITDQGPGVHAQLHARIWRPFAALATPGAPDRRGGLGLAIVRAVARGHGGDAWMEAAPGGGARFCIRLPTATAPARMAAAN